MFNKNFSIDLFKKIMYTIFIKEMEVNNMAKVTKDTIFMDALKIAPQSANLFFEIGMHCLGCPSASGESIEEACLVHGADCDELVAKINALIED